MKLKRILALASAVAVISSSSAAYAKSMEFTMGSTSLWISDGSIYQTQIETAPYTENDRTMVPVRIISENFGATVSWNEQTSEVTIENETDKIVLTLGSNEAVVNGVAVPLDAPAKEIGGRTMVPLRFISENLGKDVSYHEATEQVLISDEKPIITVNGSVYTIDDYRFVIGNTDGVEDSELVPIIEEANNIFKEVGALSTAADKANFFTSAQSLASIKESLNANSDAIYEFSLMAPIARYNSDMAKAEAYLTISSNLNISPETVASVYSSEYVKAKHILILTQDAMTAEPYSSEKKAEAEKLAKKIHQDLKKGADFDELCKQYTEDPGYQHSPDGYVFSKGEMVQEFEAAAFAMKEGEISDIVETAYGYHILKREPLPELDDEMEYNIQTGLIYKEFENLYNKCINEADIQTHMSTEEIISLLR